MNLPDLLAAAAPAGGSLCVALDDDWMQGRTAYGGLSSVLAYAAASSSADDLPPLASAQITFVAPVSGEVRASSTILRRGRNATFVRTDLICGDATALCATFTFMKSRESALDLPGPPPPAVAAPLDSPQAGFPAKRSFVDRFEWRQALPERNEADISRWLRLKEREGLDPVTELIIIGDAAPGAAMHLFDTLMPLSSVNWTINMLTPTPRSVDGWWLVRSTATQVQHGGSSQPMMLWNSSGEPIFEAMQSVAYFG